MARALASPRNSSDLTTVVSTMASLRGAMSVRDFAFPSAGEPDTLLWASQVEPNIPGRKALRP